MITFPRSDAPCVSIIVVAWREAPHLLTCLRSVRDSVAVPYEVILVLNEPSPDLEDQVRQGLEGLSVLTFHNNLGFGGAVNAAAASARGEFLLLLNDDAVVRDGWAEALLDTARRRPRSGLVGSTYLHPDGTLQEAGSVVWEDGSTSAFTDETAAATWRFERRVDYCSGGSLLIRRQLWDLLGGFDERYYPAYFEDLDLTFRAARAGWETWYQPLSVLEHVRSGSSGRLHGFLYERSRARFLELWRDNLGDHQRRDRFEAAAWRAMGHPIRVLVLDDHLPDPGLGAGYGRARDTLEALAADPGIHVSIHPTWWPRMEPDALLGRGIRVITDLAGHLSTPGVAYEVVLISRPNNFEDFYELIRSRLPQARIIYDAEALFYRRVESRIGFETAMGAAEPDLDRLRREAAEARQLESRIVSSVEAVVCISEEEAALVRAMSRRPVHVVEAWLSGPEPSTVPYEDRAHIGLVAGWAAGPGSPNTEGLLWFAHEVLPKVRAAVPGCRLLVTGAHPPSDISWLEGRSVGFVGHLPDLARFYDRIRVAISPTLYGAGVKLKTVEAIQYGVPVVATAEAAGGLEGAVRSSVWAVADERAFADAIITLYRNRKAWEEYRTRELAAAGGVAGGGSHAHRWSSLVRETVDRSSAVRGER